MTETKSVTFSAARKQHALLICVLDRACRRDEEIDRVSLLMDLESVPELDLQKLLDAPDLDFVHDIYGIRRHMDRSSWPGKLMDCFWPRCASQTEEAL